MSYHNYDPDDIPPKHMQTTEVELPPLCVEVLPDEFKEWLDQFRCTENHRKEYFMACYNYSTPRLVSLIKNSEGDLIFWQARDVITNADPKYINQPGLLKPAESFSRFQNGTNYIIIVEDLISAIRVADLGYNVHAIIGNRPNKEQTKFLQQLPVDYYILWLDPDAGGLEGVNFLTNRLRNYGMVFHVIGELEPKYRTDDKIKDVLGDYDICLPY